MSLTLAEPLLKEAENCTAGSSTSCSPQTVRKLPASTSGLVLMAHRGTALRPSQLGSKTPSVADITHSRVQQILQCLNNIQDQNLN